MPPMNMPRWKPMGWGQSSCKNPWEEPKPPCRPPMGWERPRCKNPWEEPKPPCRPPMGGPCGGGYGFQPMPPRRF